MLVSSFSLSITRLLSFTKNGSIYDRTVKTGALLIAQIHGNLLGLKSIKTLIVGPQKI
jgi:hypothetical protein